MCIIQANVKKVGNKKYWYKPVIKTGHGYYAPVAGTFIGKINGDIETRSIASMAKHDKYFFAEYGSSYIEGYSVGHISTLHQNKIGVQYNIKSARAVGRYFYQYANMEMVIIKIESKQKKVIYGVDCIGITYLIPDGKIIQEFKIKKPKENKL